MINIKNKFQNYIKKIIFEYTNDAVKKSLDEHYPQLLSSLSALHTNTTLEREKLIKARSTKKYSTPFNSKNPLVSIRISTYNRSKIITKKTLPSILNQTHKNIEVVIVGDNCTDDTEKEISKFKDKRVHFFNMNCRGYYPTNQFHKWLVAGIPAANEALQRTNGEWIVPFDDDDEMLPNHVEDLLKKAQAEKLEFVYGKAMSVNLMSKEEKVIGSFPPSYGHISFNSSIFHRDLKFFEYDPQTWTINEPGDWNLIKRMLLAGVYVGFLDKIVTKINFLHPKDKTGYNPEL